VYNSRDGNSLKKRREEERRRKDGKRYQRGSLNNYDPPVGLLCSFK
jgi:hypothetical protein